MTRRKYLIKIILWTCILIFVLICGFLFLRSQPAGPQKGPGPANAAPAAEAPKKPGPKEQPEPKGPAAPNKKPEAPKQNPGNEKTSKKTDPKAQIEDQSPPI